MFAQNHHALILQLSRKLEGLHCVLQMTDLITIDPGTLGGTPVFKGTRVPVESMFGHLKKGISLDEFLDDFPSVTREQALRVIEAAGHQFGQQLEHETVA